jgi:hypothetical protein
MRAKYGIQDSDFYNFDETGFMMGMIRAGMVVTRSDRINRPKAIQPGNRESVTAICAAAADGHISLNVRRAHLHNGPAIS